MSEAREIRPIGWTGSTGAMVSGHLRATAAIDRYEPPRSHANVMIEEIHWPPSDDGFTGAELVIIGGLSAFRLARKAVWIIDDGQTVRPYYTVMYHETEDTVGLKSFPTHFRADGSREIRPDNGREVDMSGWMIGPATAYHLKVTGV